MAPPLLAKITMASLAPSHFHKAKTNLSGSISSSWVPAEAPRPALPFVPAVIPLQNGNSFKNPGNRSRGKWSGFPRHTGSELCRVHTLGK